MLKKLLCVLILVPLLNACSTTLTNMIGEKGEPVKTELVKVYKEAPNGYEVIAEMSKKTEVTYSVSDETRLDETLEDLRSEAAELGANGILLEPVTNVSTAAYSRGVEKSSPIYRHYKLVKVVAIHVPE